MRVASGQLERRMVKVMDSDRWRYAPSDTSTPRCPFVSRQYVDSLKPPESNTYSIRHPAETPSPCPHTPSSFSTSPPPQPTASDTTSVSVTTPTGDPPGFVIQRTLVP